MTTDIVIRTGLDRLRYALLFEGILIVLFASFAALVSGHDLLETGTLAVMLALIALVVNFIYNYVFDRVDVRYGRVPTERSRKWRILHAAGFELTLVVTSLPVIMWWLDWSWWQALMFDIAAAAAVVVYTYYFTLAYDRIFPVVQSGRP